MPSPLVLAVTSIAFWLAVGIGTLLLFPAGGTAGSSTADGDESGAPEPVVPADFDELPPETDCADGIDDSGDGLVDCADPSCQDRSCNDANLCTTGDTCQDQLCVGQPRDCTHPDICTIGVCDSQDGECVNEPKCDDNDPCTVDSCDAQNDGECSNEPKCADGNTCTADSCNPENGECTNEALEGVECDDGEPATDLDACVSGVCVGIPVGN